jgi:hypothetical protein
MEENPRKNLFCGKERSQSAALPFGKGAENPESALRASFRAEKAFSTQGCLVRLACV